MGWQFTGFNPDRAGAWVDDYVESEREEWQETTKDPAGAIWENLQFGATGPAPSFEGNLGVDFGGGLFGTVNRSLWKAAGGDPDEAGSGKGLPVVLLVALVLIGVALYLLRPVLEILENLTGD